MLSTRLQNALDVLKQRFYYRVTVFQLLHQLDPFAIHLPSLLMTFKWQIDRLNPVQRLITKELNPLPFHLISSKHLLQLQ